MHEGKTRCCKGVTPCKTMVNLISIDGGVQQRVKQILTPRV